uniref:Sushi domain-containing protein 2 isoform X2 n=1 Tax=Geotrypetes seraphini TaxID=260995 RepID=A0A6P8S083_GEOSA|nr:sushi domain-containing protein 2 isoform X2 [Geotrypetes seraphini]
MNFLWTLSSFPIIMSVFLPHTAAAPESCANHCGRKLNSCSCHVTCENLGTCCVDYRNFCLSISPHSGTLMGGKDFRILHSVFNGSTSDIRCRFNNETVTTGYVDETGKAHCISPLLYESGRIPFEMSTDGGMTYLHSGTWLSVHHSKVSVTEKSVLENATKWQYYGTPGVGGNLTVVWKPDILFSAEVNIELWGYREAGDPYTEGWSPVWRYLYTLEKGHNNTGSYTFTPETANATFSSWEVGMLRIIASSHPDGQMNVPSIWSPIHALAWHLGEEFRKDPAAWAYGKCIAWHKREQIQLPDFLAEIPDCPCNLAQARDDIGRYHTDYGCDIEKGSVCTYHPGAVHCVRSIQASPRYGAGQQCCYDANGNQILTFDSLGGSTPDRGHDWGSPPYRKPPRVPGFSHWLYDVITFYYCCLWSDNCQLYLDLRPSSDCRSYTPPRVASAFGDPYFLTLDGANFTFKGKGEYTLMTSDFQSLIIQGRTDSWEHADAETGDEEDDSFVNLHHHRAAKVTGFSAVAMQEAGSDVIEVRVPKIARSTEQLEVLVNQEVVSFMEQKWMDLRGVFVYSAIDQNVTVMFPSGAGVEVRRMDRILSVSMLLPEDFLNRTRGLMGAMNNNPEDDFSFTNGSVLPADATPKELFQMGADWAVTNETSLFTYDSDLLLTNYHQKHDPVFVPVFRVQEDPSDPLTEAMQELCQSDPFCRFDVLTTQSLQVGNTTKMSHESHRRMVDSLKPVVSCGWLGPPANGTKEGTTYLVDSSIRFHCNKEYILVGSPMRTCNPDGKWSGTTARCLLGAPESCASQCGRKLSSCSCHATCENLGTCCVDYWNFCLRISPHSGTLMGGKDFRILNVTFNSGASVSCWFKDEILTTGYTDESGHAHCISPLLYETGRIPFQMSVDNGKTFPYSGTWSAVHHSKVSESDRSFLVNETKWQYYGTPHVSGELTISWAPATFQDSTVNIELWGYEESGDPYSSLWEAKWTYLYTLQRGHPNSGTFSFIPQPAKAPFSKYEVGLLRISPHQYGEGEKNLPSLWSVEHALAWHLGDDFRNNSTAWAQDKCFKWYNEEERLPNFLKEIIDCPCTLAQARADTGRFHTDYGCDIEKGSACTYHPGAVHCVRSIQGSPKYAAGQQCCYDSTGTQVLTFDSRGGSTPDRGHDWGSPPYRKPPRVPGFSHWLYDVITFYYCCLWSDNCRLYLDLRPSSDCRSYTPPGVASAFGDPHFLTIDGANYTFKGKGEYTLMRSDFHSLTIQGRAQPHTFENGTVAPVTGFSAVAMCENGSAVIEVRSVPGTSALEVLMDGEKISFEEQSWMDLIGVFIYSAIDQNVTVMFPSGAGVEVRGRNGILGVSVLLPEEFLNRTRGLMGVMNNNPEDDFSFTNGSVLPADATPEQFFQMGADWAVTNETSLFTYSYLKHDPSFVPELDPQEDPNDPLTATMRELCQADLFCRFDVLTTRNISVGNATKASHQCHQKKVESLQPVVSCGWISPPKNGGKKGTRYLSGSSVHFSCDQGYKLAGSEERTCQPNGKWSGEPAQCVSDALALFG